MKSPSKATIKKRLLAAVLAVFMAMAFPLPEMANGGKVQAAGSTAEIANVVVFVKFQDDTKEIFNATNGSYSNWQMIKNMYDEDQDSFSNYISAVTEGKVHVTNYFPQELSGGQRVQTLVIPRSGYIINEVVKALSDERIKINTTDKLDNRQAGILDNLTVIIQGNATDRGTAAFKSVYAGQEQVGGLLIRNYNMIPSAKVLSENAAVNALEQQGVISHEFLHTLGLPDLYRDSGSGSGDPVGKWDIMASVSCFLQYPLSYLRAREGWIPMKTITQSGTYTLTAVSGAGGEKVFALKTPLSDSELICLEYRKKPTDPYQFDYRIPSSGLLMYRVDNKVDGLTNHAGNNYIYVYRPGVTHPEAATDGTTDKAALDVTAGETSYGTTDLNADFTQDTLYYSDGSNSGIRISDLKLSADQNQLTFTVTFADYSQFGVWDKLDEGISGLFSEDPDICIDPATGTIYAAYTVSPSGSPYDTQVCVMRWNGAGWQQVGAAIGSARQPALAVCGGEVYLSYCKGDGTNAVYCKLNGNTWGQVATCAAQYPGSMQFAVDGNEIYGAFQEDSGNGKRLVIYDIKGRKTVTSSLTTSVDFSNPAVVKSGNSFYVVCAEFPSGSAQIREYNMSTGSWSTAYTIADVSTNTHAIVKQGQKIYAFAGRTGTGSSEGGTACLAMFDGNSWSSSSVTSMKQFNWVSMDVLEGQVYLAYYDTADEKARLLRGTGTVLEQYSDQLGIGLDFLQIRGYGDSIYAAVKAKNTDTMVVRRKVVTESSVTPPTPQNPRMLTLTPPAGYDDNVIYVDGMEYAAEKTGNSYQVELPDTLGKTAVMYSYDSKNIPVGMYVWKLEWNGQTCTAVPLPGLQDLLSYHGFSIRVQSPAGIRFKSGIDAGLKQQLITAGVDGCVLKEYGTLFITNENREKYPFVKGGTKVGGGRAYWTENGVVNDKVFETVSGRNRFTSVLINLAPNMYAKDISFRAYAVLDCGGQEIIVYGPPVYRSVYTVAKQVQAKGEFKVGSSGYKYVQGIIDSVEGR